VIKMGVAVRNLLHEFGFNHDSGPLLWKSKLRVPKHEQTVKPRAFDLPSQAFKA
jgi:hypothetical protein